jgi:uncharacterized protein with HEPN domain
VSDGSRFVPRPRVDQREVSDADRWPALRAALLDLLAECSAIIALGRAAFDQQRSLSYRAAEAVVIHFDDLLERLPSDRIGLLPQELSLSAVRRTRNILSHDYRRATKDIVWDVIENRIPAVILAVVE